MQVAIKWVISAGKDGSENTRKVTTLKSTPVYAQSILPSCSRFLGHTHIGSAGVIAAVGFKARRIVRYAVGLGSGSIPECPA